MLKLEKETFFFKNREKLNLPPDDMVSDMYLFTVETLGRRQPDVKAYGRVFSWTFIFLVNVVLVLVWLVATTPLAFETLGGILLRRVTSAYAATGLFFWNAIRWAWERCAGR